MIALLVVILTLLFALGTISPLLITDEDSHLVDVDTYSNPRS